MCGYGHSLENHAVVKQVKTKGTSTITLWTCTECTRINNKVSRYGLTIEDYETMMIDQDHNCKICKKEFSSNKDNCIDHDHSCCNDLPNGQRSCGKCVRGIVCKKCNLILGMVNDSKEYLMDCIEYLSGDSDA